MAAIGQLFRITMNGPGCGFLVQGPGMGKTGQSSSLLFLFPSSSLSFSFVILLLWLVQTLAFAQLFLQK